MNTVEGMTVWVQLNRNPAPPRGLDRLISGAATVETFRSTADLPTGTCDLLLLPAPLRIADRRLHHFSLWKKYFFPAPPRILLYGFLSIDHPLYVDLLQDNYILTEATSLDPTTVSSVESGMDSIELLRLFLAGHGFNSIRSVLNQLLLTIQIAEREMRGTDASAAEIQRELFAPIDFPGVWREWQARWANYAPLFAGSPIAGRLDDINKKMATFGCWVLANDPAANSLTSGKLTEILTSAKDEFTSLERIYLS